MRDICETSCQILIAIHVNENPTGFNELLELILPPLTSFLLQLDINGVLPNASTGPMTEDIHPLDHNSILYNILENFPLTQLMQDLGINPRDKSQPALPNGNNMQQQVTSLDQPSSRNALPTPVSSTSTI